jgi:H2-forming N5,N10-methylenetetrahydromethanopterin dehydrogenase-like enzyme
MRAEPLEPADPRFQAAVEELQALIHQHYPTTSFAVVQGTDPEGTYVLATVDVEDPDAVVDVYIDRLLELQINEGLPVYVIPIRPLARVVVPQP